MGIRPSSPRSVVHRSNPRDVGIWNPHEPANDDDRVVMAEVGKQLALARRRKPVDEAVRDGAHHLALLINSPGDKSACQNPADAIVRWLRDERQHAFGRVLHHQRREPHAQVHVGTRAIEPPISDHLDRDFV